MTIRNPLHQLVELSDHLRMRENEQEAHLVASLSEMSVLDWNSLSVEAKVLLKRCVVKYGLAEKLSEMRSLSIVISKWEPNQTASPECPNSSASETKETCSKPECSKGCFYPYHCATASQEEKTVAQVLVESTPDFKAFVETLISTNTRYSKMIDELMTVNAVLRAFQTVKVDTDLDTSLPPGTFRTTDTTCIWQTNFNRLIPGDSYHLLCSDGTIHNDVPYLGVQGNHWPTTLYGLSFIGFCPSTKKPKEATSAPEWITDGPPAGVGSYLVTLEDTVLERRKTHRAWWTGTYWGSYNRRIWTVIAWKPMPEPMQ